LLFPLFAVLLNCPYPDPSVYACFFFPFSFAPRRGEGRPRATFVAGCSRTRTQSWQNLRELSLLYQTFSIYHLLLQVQKSSCILSQIIKKTKIRVPEQQYDKPRNYSSNSLNNDSVLRRKVNRG